MWPFQYFLFIFSHGWIYQGNDQVQQRILVVAHLIKHHSRPTIINISFCCLWHVTKPWGFWQHVIIQVALQHTSKSVSVEIRINTSLCRFCQAICQRVVNDGRPLLHMRWESFHSFSSSDPSSTVLGQVSSLIKIPFLPPLSLPPTIM